MSSFKIIFLVAKIILALSITAASAKDLNNIVAAKVNDHIISAQDVLKALEKLEVTGRQDRRRELLRLVKSQYEDLFQKLDAVPHPVFGDRG